MTDDDLDALLCAPLEDVADDGFSGRIAVRAGRQAWWRERLTLFAPVAAVAALVPFLPGEQLTETALRLSPILANSGAVALAVAALILTLSFERRLRESAL